jgi:hypothetical protein
MKLHIPVAVLVATLAIPATAQAANDPVGGCAASRQLLSIDETLLMVDEQIYDAEGWAAIAALIASVDANGDGRLCSKQFSPNRGQDKHWGGVDYVITQIGDNQVTGRTPG